MGEHPAAIGTPKAFRVATITAEPPTSVVAYHAEYGKIAARIDDGLHREQNPILQGLIRILETELRADFRRNQVDAEFLRSMVDRFTASALPKTELANGYLHELDLRFSVGKGDLL